MSVLVSERNVKQVPKRTLKPRQTPFGRWLSVAREQRGLTMQSLAEAVEISHAHISKLEAGTGKPSRDMVQRLVQGLLVEGADEIVVRELLNSGLKAAGFMPAEDPGNDLTIKLSSDAIWIAEQYMGADAPIQNAAKALLGTVTVHRPDGSTVEMTREEVLQEAAHSDTTVGKRAE